MRRLLLPLAIGSIPLFVSCASTPKRNAVPVELVAKVGIEGVPKARFWGDEWPKWSIENLESGTDAEFRRNYPAIYGQPHNYLALSGGGANGAFGAGVLLGWSEHGTRPEFTMVTGISTGALAAPFAFLGEKYDAKLREVYTQTSTKDIARKRSVVTVLMSDSLAETGPLKKTIAKHITPSLLDEVAAEHRTGRRLYVGTMNLDAGRPVIWSIGEIANSDYPGKVQLIHEILRASSAIPVAFPPVSIPVAYGGEAYEELHADGGAGSQVFIYPAAIDFKRVTSALKVRGRPNVFVIRNAFLDADYQGVKRSVFPIAGRTISSLIRTQGVGDLFQIFALCQRDENRFHLAYIPADFDVEPEEPFDPKYMRQLFELGYERAKAGYPWMDAPPGY